MPVLLVVDDEQSICWGLRRLGERMGCDVATMASAEDGLAAITDLSPDVIVLDVRLPGMDGLTAIEQFRQKVGRIPIIVITAYGDLQTAVDAVRRGAFEYVVKPFDLDKMEHVLRRALTSGKQTHSVDLGGNNSTGGLLGSSQAIQDVFKHIALAAASDAGVLLFGESGTGKELAARAIHNFSDRSAGPFVAVNLASLSSTIAESELFGHVRSAFTGADHDRTGFLEQAGGGTLFLDEVADIPLSTQVKLLRSLEQREVTPVGSGNSVKTDFRVISATHQDLLKGIKEGTFRHDLYFRLGAFRIDIPPLRNRRGDIRELAEYFVREAGDRSKVSTSLSNGAIEELEVRPWFGNVRELRNAIEHAVIVARDRLIEPEHLPAPADASLLANQESDISLSDSITLLVRQWADAQLKKNSHEGVYEQLLRLIEPPLFEAAFQKQHGQCSAAARQLGIHRTTLRKKLDQYGISES